MPEAFAGPEWEGARIMGRARRIGPSCAAFMDRIFDRANIKEQAYNPALSVLNCRGSTATSGSMPHALRNAGIWPQEHLGDRADHAGGLVAGEHAYAAKLSWLAIELAYATAGSICKLAEQVILTMRVFCWRWVANLPVIAKHFLKHAFDLKLHEGRSI